ncbi:hypothetical protein [Arthrobacter sp. BE255]|uniref:hypothetical protein n=1 Tax=Arthrobacter sp. BE255 TaxID=2817721 RepID=UPI0028608C4A|nr:hypothetical protein [Arthrobacter sp. BE255]MDR7161053.1 hypothetical protein [Arthrobacter sp. BE255]
MNTHIRRFAMLSSATLLALAMGLPAAQAANHRASCVGLIVSSEASAGVLDVNMYKAIAEAGGYSTFGQFVAGGAHVHLGSVEACVPQ